MFRHILVPVDCTEESRRLALAVVQSFGSMISCRVTLVAMVTPADNTELHSRRVRHAEEALGRLHTLLLGYGVWAKGKVLEGEDHASAIAAESISKEFLYDLIVLGTHQTLPEDPEEPCRGSLVERVSKRVSLPVMVVPEREVRFTV